MNRTQQQARTRRATLARWDRTPPLWHPVLTEFMAAFDDAMDALEAAIERHTYQPTPAHLLTALEAEPHAWGGAPE